jgi:hypothetical protein
LINLEKKLLYEKKICFGVFANTFSINVNNLDGTPLINDFVLNISAVPSKGAMIIFDPIGQVIIE